MLRISSARPRATVRSTDVRSTAVHSAAARSAAALSAAALALALVAGCSPTAPAESAPADPAPAADSVQVIDAWVKAVDEGMSGGFALLDNTGDADITVVAARTDAATTVELHEVVMSDGAMIMQPKEGGFVIAAADRHELVPGGDHIMLMGITRPFLPGDEVVVTLEFSDGSTLEHAFTVKEFTGAEEEYSGDLGDHGNG